MCKRLKIAILDSGINQFSTGYVHSISYVENELYDYYGHGTLCFNLMKIYLGSNHDIFIVKILDNQGKCNIKRLNSSLISMVDSDINIINLSLAIKSKNNLEEYKVLKEICEELKERGKIIICSLNNHENDYSIPAGYSSVLGVRGAYFFDDMTYWYNGRRKVQAVTNGSPVLLRSFDGKWKIFSGNSKATVLMTCILAKLISNNYDIQKTLYNNAQKNEWNEQMLASLYKNWMSYDGSIYKCIDQSLLKIITDIVYQYFGDAKDINKFFTYRNNLGDSNVISVDDYIKLINLIENRISIKIQNQFIDIKDFSNVYSLCYAIKEHWSK